VNPPNPTVFPSPIQPVKKPSRWGALRYLKAIPYLLMLLAVITLGTLFVPGPLGEPKTVIIPHGAGTREVANVLDSAGAIYCPILFRIAVKISAANALKAGEYELTPGQSLMDILTMIHEGRSVVHLFTVAEGLTSLEITRLLMAVPILTGTIAVPPEGSLQPESYRYMYGDTRSSLIARMQKPMQEVLNDLWAKRDQSIPLATPEEAVVMASVIEKETGKPAERPRIAGVFYNRLHQHMRLQSDPTVIYGILQAKGIMDHDIEHDDLAFPSPYNTYTNDGLPPKPICNPGRAALEAALHPEANNYLYFVADGTGGHSFASTLAEHNQNVAKWNALQAKKP
jgi:UPF0755 protein